MDPKENLRVLCRDSLPDDKVPRKTQMYLVYWQFQICLYAYREKKVWPVPCVWCRNSVISSNTGGLAHVNINGITGYTSSVGDVPKMSNDAISLAE